MASSNDLCLPEYSTIAYPDKQLLTRSYGDEKFQ